jgi:hypothetical protein
MTVSHGELTAPIPGGREAGMLTRFGAPAPDIGAIPEGSSTMDPLTIAERRREGGGAPRERRPASARAVLLHPMRWLTGSASSNS